MTTTPEQIDLWRQSHSEYQRLEFKEAKTQFDNKWISAQSDGLQSRKRHFDKTPLHRSYQALILPRVDHLCLMK